MCIDPKSMLTWPAGNVLCCILMLFFRPISICLSSRKSPNFVHFLDQCSLNLSEWMWSSTSDSSFPSLTLRGEQIQSLPSAPVSPAALNSNGKRPVFTNLAHIARDTKCYGAPETVICQLTMNLNTNLFPLLFIVRAPRSWSFVKISRSLGGRRLASRWRLISRTRWRVTASLVTLMFLAAVFWKKKIRTEASTQEECTDLHVKGGCNATGTPATCYSSWLLSQAGTDPRFFFKGALCTCHNFTRNARFPQLSQGASW